MARHDRTSIGGPKGAFQSTHWSLIVRARTDDESQRREVMGEILGRYWKPVYCYLRRKGYNNDEAQDLVQGFFEEIVLGRNLVEMADRTKGRFRALLLLALDRYTTSVRRAQTARKRAPGSGLVSLDASELAPACEPYSQATPEQAFTYTWAAALLDRVLADCERECRAAGQAVHWEVFRDRVIGPIRDDAEAPSLAALCAAHGIPNAVVASNMIVTVKRRFQAALARHVRHMVHSQAEVKAEIQDLMAILSGGGAGS
jgi:RNA polymerase sigma-70 factor (ECF subfamily)